MATLYTMQPQAPRTPRTATQQGRRPGWHPSAEQLTAHLFQQLTEAEAVDISAHVRNCRECRAQRRAMTGYLRMAGA